MRFKNATANNVAENVEKKEKIEKSFETPTPKIEIPEFREAVARIPVNLRLGPSTEENALCVLYPDIVVKVRPYNKDWFALTYQGRDCFVMKEYMQIK